MLNENLLILSPISLGVVSKGPMGGERPLDQVMVWHQLVDNPLPELMVAQLNDVYLTELMVIQFDDANVHQSCYKELMWLVQRIDI